MKNVIAISVFAIVLSSLPAPCLAEEKHDHVCFRKLDADNDGRVTYEEFAKYFGDDEETFKSADADRDGRLTHDEYHDLLGHGAL